MKGHRSGVLQKEVKDIRCLSEKDTMVSVLKNEREESERSKSRRKTLAPGKLCITELIVPDASAETPRLPVF